MIRCGILGYGYMGTIRERVLSERDDVEVTRIFHTDSAPRRAPTWEEVVDDPAIDGVFVCLPNHLTCEVTCRALSAGKHVFAEKPPGISVSEVEQMIAAESASGRVLKFGFNHRYHPAVREAFDRIESGELGRLLWARGRYGKPIAEDFDTGWRADPERSGGGILIDQGIHMLDLLVRLCGDVQIAHAVASGSREVEDDLMAILKNNRGQLASLHSSNTQWPALFCLEVGLSAGAVKVEGLLSRSGRYGPETLTWGPRGDPRGETRVYDTDDSWQIEVEEWVSAITRGTPVSVGSTADALTLMRLAESLYAAIETPSGLHGALP